MPGAGRPANIRLVMPRSFGAWVLSIALGACASSSPPEAEAPAGGQAAAEEEETDAEPERAPPPPGALWRDEVDETVDAGLGWFLQLVEVEPSLDNGRFKGFRIVDLRPSSYWRGVDLRPGDVVVSVNGKSIERDKEAFDVFKSLKKEGELRVKYLRAGRERELVYRIVAPPPPAPQRPAS